MSSDARGQLVTRIAALLRTVSSHEPEGVTTSEVARSTDLARPTVHRLLSSLADEGLVDRDPASGRWALGPELYLLGSLASVRYDITDLAGDVLRDLARATGESVFLSARRGDETVCLAMEEGSFPLRSHVLHIGIRFPLGVASAGLAILAHMPDQEIEAYLSRTDLTEGWGPDHARPALEKRIEATRLAGYAVNPALIVEGSWGMGAAVFDHRGAPTWALSLTGVESRFRPDRVPELGEALLDSAHRLTQLLRHRPR